MGLSLEGSAIRLFFWEVQWSHYTTCCVDTQVCGRCRTCMFGQSSIEQFASKRASISHSIGFYFYIYSGSLFSPLIPAFSTELTDDSRHDGLMDPTSWSTVFSLEGNKEHRITNVVKSPYTASSTIHIILMHFTASQNWKLIQFHCLPWAGMPSTAPGCSEHRPAWPGISFIMFLFPQKPDLSLKNTLWPAKTHHVTMTDRQVYFERPKSTWSSPVNTRGEKSQKEEFLLLQISYMWKRQKLLLTHP